MFGHFGPNRLHCVWLGSRHFYYSMSRVISPRVFIQSISNLGTMILRFSGGGGVCNDFSKSYIMFFRIYSGFMDHYVEQSRSNDLQTRQKCG